MHPLPLAQIIQTVLDAFPDTQGIYLYGSYAAGDQNADSDVDLAILLPHPSANKARTLYFSDLFTQLSRLLERELDLINLRLAPTVLGNEIVSKGRRIFCGDEAACDEFDALNLSYYQKLNEERSKILADFLRTKRAYAV